MFVVLILVLVNVYLFATTKEPEKVRVVREKYNTLREALISRDRKSVV